MTSRRKKVHALHLASFEGNIGDNANHYGFRNQVKINTDYDIEYTNLEIREFYWKQRKFDQDFVDHVNKHDLLIIGGGNYFELWVENSATGTSIDIKPELFKKIAKPVFFNALGVDVGQGAPPESVDKFQKFLDILLGSRQYLVSVRNDGAHDAIKNLFPKEYADRIHRVPDGGFYVNPEESYHPEISDDRRIIAINLAGDMLDTRFHNDENSLSDKISYREFSHKFAETLNGILSAHHDVDIVFIPHIFRDLSTISDCLSFIDDQYRRRRIRVAPYLIGNTGCNYIFDLYRHCDLVMGMRFHANVCAIGMGVPTVGLVNYLQIEQLYKELEIPDRTVFVNVPDFQSSLHSVIEKSLSNKDSIKRQYNVIRQKLLFDISTFHTILNQWLHDHF